MLRELKDAKKVFTHTHTAITWAVEVGVQNTQCTEITAKHINQFILYQC